MGALLKDAFSFPFREGSVMILVWGAILGVASDLSTPIPILGFFAYLIITAYFCSILFEIISTTAVGQDRCPQFPSATDLLDDLIFPFLKVTGIGLLCFLPAFIVEVQHDGEGFSLLGILLLLAGSAYFPMAVLAVAVLNQFTALSPHIVFPAIARSGGLYWIVVAIFILVFLLESTILGFLGNIFIVGPLISAGLAMLTLMINGRLLGLLYREKEEELNWL